MSCYTFITKILYRNKIGAETSIVENEMPAHGDSEVVTSLRRLVDEKTRELKLKAETIRLLEKELDDKDNLIKHLQNEIDKFRQVVKPLTHKIITKQLSFKGHAEHRIKRQAISAEPLSKEVCMQIKKVSKSSR